MHMNKKDFIILLAPIVMFITVAGTALSLADTIQRRVLAGDSHQKFEAFVQNVESGKFQLTTDRWLEGMRRQQATAEAYLKADAASRDLMMWLMWAALFGIIFQVGAVIHFNKRLKVT